MRMTAFFVLRAGKSQKVTNFVRKSDRHSGGVFQLKSVLMGDGGRTFQLVKRDVHYGQLVRPREDQVTNYDCSQHDIESRLRAVVTA